MSHSNGTATKWIIGTLTSVVMASFSWALVSANNQDHNQDISINTTIQRVTTLEANYATLLETSKRIETKVDKLVEQVKWRK